MHEFDPTGHRHQSSDTVFPSTVLWIGDRNADEFESAFAITETFAAQIAYRPTIQSAVTRMASGVARIILTRSNRQALQQDRIKQLGSLYPNAEIVELLGPLCVGEAAKWTAPSEIRRIYPNQINDFLAQWLAADSPAATSRTTRYSVAVIAQTLAAAEPLMDLATDAGASVVWCRQSDTYRVRTSTWFGGTIRQPKERTIVRHRFGMNGWQTWPTAAGAATKNMPGSSACPICSNAAPQWTRESIGSKPSPARLKACEQ